VALRAITKRFRFVVSSFCAVLLALGVCFPSASLAQPNLFGSLDDPREYVRQPWWQRGNSLNLMGGLSLIGPQWRGAAGLSADLVSEPFTSRFSTAFRAGSLGRYLPDFDEPYDALRAVTFIRHNPTPLNPFYVRLGPLERTRLGTGHIVNFFNSRVAWDERTVGAEAAWTLPHFQATAFADNVLPDGVVGGRLGITPFASLANPRTRSVQLGLGYVSDLSTRGDTLPELAAYNVDLSFDLVESEDLGVMPFVSAAWYTEYGSGVGAGADFSSENFIDLGRFHVRFALFYNGNAFIPGYIGSFYQVSNTRNRIVQSVDSLDQSAQEQLAGIPLGEAVGGNDLVTELRLLIFDRFEIWYNFRRHYGSQRLSEYHLRLFVRAPERLTVSLGMDRGGLRGFLSLFNRLDDETALTFDADYHVGGPLWAYIRSQYTFEAVGNRSTDEPRYLVQRRFEPLLGVRLSW
jgi:hypothetical protein